MKRLVIEERPNWQKSVEHHNLDFHTINGEKYWDETACYEFTAAEIDELETATQEINSMTLEVVQKVITDDLFSKLCIPNWCVVPIINSWDFDEPTIYGRFDFNCRPGEKPKLFEYNADTPTSLLEASVIQWFWQQDKFPHFDQFNSIHEKLIARFQRWPYDNAMLHFACVRDHDEDRGTVNYMRDCAIQAGLPTEFLYMDEIGYDAVKKRFFDMQNRTITHLFKLYPWEWMINEKFGEHIFESTTKFIEPAWKMILSNKGILPLMWEMFPDHPNLLPSYFTNKIQGDFVRKPLLSREGANILISKGGVLTETAGDYGEEGYVYQELCELPNFDGNYPVVGSWVIEGESAGIGIREDKNLVTANLSRFIPHYFK